MQYSPPCENGECMGNNCCDCQDGCINGTYIAPGLCICSDGFELCPTNPFVCVLKGVAAMKNAPLKANVITYVHLILALFIVLFSAIILIWLVNRRQRKVNYNVDKKGRTGKK